MSKGFKNVLKIGLAIAVPFAAPAIVGAVAGSSALAGIAGGTAIKGALGTTIGKTIGSAVVGGALSKAAGGSFVQGAVTGGVAGYSGIGTPKPMAARVGEGFTDMRGLVDAASTAPATLGSRIMGAITSAGGNIAQGLTNPDMWGRAAQYLGAAALGKATAKPDPALQMYIDELRRVSTDNRAVQQAAFGVGNELVAQARGINPIAEGQIAANEAQLRTIAAGQQAVRDIDPSRQALRAVGTQQYYTDAARAGAAAFNVGLRGGREERRVGLQGAYSGTPILQAQGGTAAQLSMQQGLNEGNRQAALLESLKYITTGQEPTGQQTQGQQTQGQKPAGGVGTSPIVPPGSVTGRPVLPDPNNPIYETVGI